MQATNALRGISDRTLERWTRVLAVLLLVGIPLMAAFYWIDRHPDPGPSLEARAISGAEAALRAAPNDLDARSRLATAYVAGGRAEEGIAQFGEVLRADPSNRAALIGRGLAYLGLDELDAARTDFQSFVDGNKDREMAGSDAQLEQAYYQLGAIALRQDRAQDAAAAFTSALRIDASDADALYGLGRALITTGDASKGVSALRRAVAFVPTGWCAPYEALVDGYRALADANGVTYAQGMVAACRGDFVTADPQLRSLASTTYAVDALVGLAYSAAQQGDRDGAATLYREALAKDPGNVSAGIGLQLLGTSDAHASVPAAQPAGSP